MDYVIPPTINNSESPLILPSSLLASASSTILHLNKSSPIIDIKSNFLEDNKPRLNTLVEENITSVKEEKYAATTTCSKVASTSTSSNSSVKLEQPQNLFYSEQQINFGPHNIPLTNRTSEILTADYSSINKSFFNPQFSPIRTSSQQQPFNFDYSAYSNNVSNLHEGLMVGIGPSMGFYDLAAAAALMTGATSSNSNYYYENISNYPQNSYYYPFDGISMQNIPANIYSSNQANGISTQRRSNRCIPSLPSNTLNFSKSSTNFSAAKDFINNGAVTSTFLTPNKTDFISSYSHNESLYSSANSQNIASLGFLEIFINL